MPMLRNGVCVFRHCQHIADISSSIRDTLPKTISPLPNQKRDTKQYRGGQSSASKLGAGSMDSCSMFEWKRQAGIKPAENERNGWRGMFGSSATLLGHKVWIIGGFSNAGNFFTLAVNSKEWKQIEVAGQSDYVFALHTVNLYQDKMYLYGVKTSNNRQPAWRGLPTLVALDPLLNELTEIPTYGDSAKPPGRHQHSADVCEKLGLLTIFGGEKLVRNQLWIFDFSKSSWTRPKCHGEEPAPRSKHVSCIVDTALYVVTGGKNGQAYEDFYRVNLAHLVRGQSVVWHKLVVHSDKWFGRRGPGMAYVGAGRLIVFGGYDGTQNTNDLSVIENIFSADSKCRFTTALKPELGSERRKEPWAYIGNPPSARECVRIVFGHGKIYVFGGTAHDEWDYFELHPYENK